MKILVTTNTDGKKLTNEREARVGSAVSIGIKKNEGKVARHTVNLEWIERPRTIPSGHVLGIELTTADAIELRNLCQDLIEFARIQETDERLIQALDNGILVDADNQVVEPIIGVPSPTPWADNPTFALQDEIPVRPGESISDAMRADYARERREWFEKNPDALFYLNKSRLGSADSIDGDEETILSIADAARSEGRYLTAAEVRRLERGPIAWRDDPSDDEDLGGGIVLTGDAARGYRYAQASFEGFLAHLTPDQLRTVKIGPWDNFQLIRKDS